METVGVNYKYAYLIANVFFLLVWLAIFWRAKEFRKPMLIMSLITASFGPISELWYFADYWRPEIALPLPVGGVEDLLFGFSIGGIAAFGYEALFVRGICKCQEKKLKKEWFLLLFPQGHSWMERIWKLSGKPEGVILFKHIPWTEMFWGLSWGLVWGPMYEFLVGARVISFKLGGHK